MKVHSQHKEQENRLVKQKRSATEGSQTPSTSKLSTATSANQVSEEDVFARLVNDEISRTLGSEGVEKFNEYETDTTKEEEEGNATLNT